jgi:hypothetical protein
LAVWEDKGLFQQPQAITLKTPYQESCRTAPPSGSTV